MALNDQGSALAPTRDSEPTPAELSSCIG